MAKLTNLYSNRTQITSFRKPLCLLEPSQSKKNDPGMAPTSQDSKKDCEDCYLWLHPPTHFLTVKIHDYSKRLLNEQYTVLFQFF